MEDEQLRARIRGRAYQRRASLEVFATELVWRAQRGQLHPTGEIKRVALEKLTVFALSEQTWTGSSTFGLLLVLLAFGFLLSDSAAVWASAAIGAVGGSGILLRRAFPAIWLTIRTDEVVLLLRVAHRSVLDARRMVALLQTGRPELAGRSPERLTRLLGQSWRALIEGEQALRRRYRRLAGERATRPEEDLFVRVQRWRSVWLLAWSLLLSVGGAAAVQLVLPPQPLAGLLVRIGLWFFLLLVTGVLIQGALWPRVERRLRD